MQWRIPGGSKRTIAFRCGALPRWAMAGMAFVLANAAWAQDPSGKDANKDKEISVTVKGPDTDAGLLLSANATAKEVGLPVYPGAIPYKEPEKDNESSAVKMGLWGSSFGFKLAVLKMESKDDPKKIASYYQKALGKYGKVLDCSNPPPQQAAEDKSGKLTCADDKADPGGMLFKAGTPEKKHMVAIQPKGNGALFQLLYIEAHGDKSK